MPFASCSSKSFQSTHPLRGATLWSGAGWQGSNISIHAPLAGCDYPPTCPGASRSISIHAPLAGCDSRGNRASLAQKYFNPRTPCGVRRGYVIANHPFAHFNPRTPCGVRLRAQISRASLPNFNPRTPCGVRPMGCARCRKGRHFNPRTPCGVRRPTAKTRRADMLFQSTHPLRGAT